jgi:hypothetical protein
MTIDKSRKEQKGMVWYDARRVSVGRLSRSKYSPVEGALVVASLVWSGETEQVAIVSVLFNES